MTTGSLTTEEDFVRFKKNETFFQLLSMMAYIFLCGPHPVAGWTLLKQENLDYYDDSHSCRICLTCYKELVQWHEAAVSPGLILLYTLLICSFCLFFSSLLSVYVFTAVSYYLSLVQLAKQIYTSQPFNGLFEMIKLLPHSVSSFTTLMYISGKEVTSCLITTRGRHHFST